MDQASTIRLLQDRVGELEDGHCLLCDRIVTIEVRTSIVAYDLCIDNRLPSGSDADDKEGSSNEVMSSPSDSSSDLDSSRSSLYDDGGQTFLPVVIIDVDEDPAKNIELLPFRGPILAMLPGPSVVMILVPIEEEVDIMNDVRFIPPSLQGDKTAGLDVDPQEEEGEVKEEELEGRVLGLWSSRLVIIWNSRSYYMMFL